MNCKQAHQNILNGFSDIETENHLHACSSCQNLKLLIDSGMQILDEEVKIPENLTEKILGAIPKQITVKTRKINFGIYAQIAAVLAIGIFLGVVLGKNANTELLLSKKDKKKEMLVKYRASLNMDLETEQTYFFQ